jgi:cytochrome c biogenesis protein CcmG/thiol:disulfide interchange protein DsbE
MTAVAGPAGAGGRVRARRRHTVLWSAVSAAIVLAILIAVLATRKAATDVQAGSPLLGHSAPVLAGPDLTGHQVSLAQYAGKWVLVNFFATWCVPCQEEHPDLISFNNRHRAAGDAVLLGVIYDARDASSVAPFFKKNGGDWPVIRDDSAKVDYGTTGVPETFIIDPSGYVVTRITGRVTEGGLDTILQRAQSAGA